MGINLFLISESYPLAEGGIFIDDEMKIIAHNFDKIYILVIKQENKHINYYLPKNLEIIFYDESITVNDKFKSFFTIFSFLFLKEFISTFKRKQNKISVSICKVMLMDIVRSSIVLRKLNETISERKINKEQTIFYTYWHDYKALALARFRKKNQSVVSISRAHGWDVFANRQTTNYLPYKKFILENLTLTLPISEVGLTELQKYSKKGNIVVSRLGKLNNRIPNSSKIKKSILICSCSNLIPLKRIHLLIDILSILKLNNLRWVHFGDGPLKRELANLAMEKLSKVNFEFKGFVSNNEILDFYNDNFVDLFINLSDSEGVPVSIMEALSAGIPVLATDVGGTYEIVNNDYGFLIPKEFKIEEVAAIIEGYLNSSFENQMKYRRNSYNFWAENFEAKKNYLEFFKIIKNTKCV